MEHKSITRTAAQAKCREVERRMQAALLALRDLRVCLRENDSDAAYSDALDVEDFAWQAAETAKLLRERLLSAYEITD